MSDDKASTVNPSPMPPLIQDDTPTIGQTDQTLLQDKDQAPAQPPPDESSELPPVMTIEAWLQKLRSSDRAFYNIMAMEVWSLAKSMDSLLPGFWSRFMQNRRSAMQEFVERRRHEGQPESPAASEAETESGEPTQQQP